MMQVQINIEHTLEPLAQAQNGEHTVVHVAIAGRSFAFRVMPTAQPVDHVAEVARAEQVGRALSSAAHVRAQLENVVVENGTVVLEAVQSVLVAHVLRRVRCLLAEAHVDALLQVIHIGRRVEGLEELGLAWLNTNHSSRRFTNEC